MRAAGLRGAGPWIPFGLLGAYALLCVFVWYEPEWRPEWDSALYVLLARSLATGEGYQYLGEPFSLRPPGFSLLIAPWTQPGAFDAAPLNRLVMVFAAASVAAVYFAFAARHGRGIALATALLSGTSSLFVERFNWVLSEFPFLVALYLGFGCLDRMERSGRAGSLVAIAAALGFGSAFYLRSVAVLVLPALVVGALLSRGTPGRRRLLLTALLVLLMALPWLGYTRQVAASATRPSEQLLVASYGTATLRVDPGDPGSDPLSAAAWIERVRHNGAWIATTLARSVLSSDSPAAAIGLTVALLVGWMLAARREPVFSSFVLLYLALLVTYFATAPRLLLPLVPAVYLALFYVLRVAGRWLGGQERAVLAAGCAFFALVNLGRMPPALDARDWPAERGPLGARWNDAERLAAWVRSNTDPEAVLLCHDAPIQALLTERRVYTYRFRPGPELLERIDPDFVAFEGPRGVPREFARLVGKRAGRVLRLPSDRFERGIPIVAMRRATEARPAQPSPGGSPAAPPPGAR